MPAIDPALLPCLRQLGAGCLEQIESATTPPLGGGPVDSSLKKFLEELDPAIWSTIAKDKHALLRSGLWLLAGDLDRSHAISQAIESVDGSYWHGIMHRREGDFGNAKYWFRKVGKHPVIASLADQYPDRFGDAFEFVDVCQRALASGDVSLISDCEAIQWAEWMSLMAHQIQPAKKA